MKVEAPGGGLSKLEKLFIKTFLMPCIKFVFTWESALKLLNKEAKTIESIVCKIKKDDLQKRVLINRTFGIEDNSRDSSFNIVLEHLVIVGDGI